MADRWGICGLVLLALCVACGGSDQSQFVAEILTARGVDKDYRPIDPTSQYTPDAVFYCVLHLSDLPDDELITARWFYEGQGREKDNLVDASLLYESAYQASEGGSGYVAFELRSPNPWPSGAYRVEVFIQGQRVGQAHFDVVAETP